MEFLSIVMVKLALEDYFKTMRFWLNEGNYSVYSSIFDMFSGYIRALYHAELMSESIYDRLFDIGNNLWKGGDC